MLFYRQKKKEQTDALHHEYGVVRNCAYIIRAFLRYRKSVVAFLVIGGIAGASMSYIWTVIAKLVIDMITRQSGAENADITPLLWLVIGTTVVEFVMMWLNTLSAKKLRIGFMVTRNELVQERIAKTLSMEYEQLEDPDMLDRLQKAKRGAEGDWQGLGALMTNMWSAAVQITAVIAAVGIIATLNLWLVLIIFVLSFIQFEYFDYIRIKDKEVMWDAMAPHWRRMNYMQTVSTDFSYAKDIRLYGMKPWLLGKYRDINRIEPGALDTVPEILGLEQLVRPGNIPCAQRDNLRLADLRYAGERNVHRRFHAVHGQRDGAFDVRRPVPPVAGGNAGALCKVDDFRSYMDIKNADELQEKHTPVPRADRYTFEFRNVSYKYRGQETYALKNLNLTFSAGQRLAVVGLNGAARLRL